MTREDKKLLLKDLCARLCYGVICSVEYKDIHWKTNDMKLSGMSDSDYLYFTNEMGGSAYSNTFKPYLRPMSSMTEEEKLHVELRYGFFYHDGVLDNVHIFEAGGTYDRDGNYDPPCKYREQRHVTIEQVLDFIHWLNAHHFDYRRLIEKGLAIEVTKENNPYK